MEDVGTGVGYVVRSAKASCERLRGRGSCGDEENSSNAGSKDAAGFFEHLVGD